MQLKQRVDAFKIMVPLISKLRHPGIRSRHWEMIASELNFRIPPENVNNFVIVFKFMVIYKFYIGIHIGIRDVVAFRTIV